MIVNSGTLLHASRANPVSAFGFAKANLHVHVYYTKLTERST